MTVQLYESRIECQLDFTEINALFIYSQSRFSVAILITMTYDRDSWLNSNLGLPDMQHAAAVTFKAGF